MSNIKESIKLVFDEKKKLPIIDSDKDTLDNKKKYIINKVKKLSKYELLEIYKIIKKNNIKYTENNNGIFLNLNIIPNKIIDQIEKYIIFFETKKESLIMEKNKRDNIAKLIKQEYITENNKIDDTNINDNSIITNEQDYEISNGIKFDNNNLIDEDKNEMYYQESNFIMPNIN